MMMSLTLKTVWISDVHLGTRECRAADLLHFLRAVRTEKLYLVGDILDLENMTRRFYWHRLHSEVIETVAALAARGVEVIYIPGNHDAALRELCGKRVGHIALRRQAVHTTADGRRLLVIHGDEFDDHLRYGPLTRWLGGAVWDVIHGFDAALNRLAERTRLFVAMPPFSIGAWIKRRVGCVNRYVRAFERAARRAAERERADGIICGHIHVPRLETTQGKGFCYANDGDWVESCSALVERPDGQLALLDWRGAAAAVSGPALDEYVFSYSPARSTLDRP